MRKRRKSKTKSRKSTRRRRRLFGAAAKSHAKKTSRRKRRKAPKAKARKRRKSRSGIRKRPTIIVSRSGKYYRPKRSRFFKRPRRVNGRRRRRNGASLVASIRNVMQVKTVARYAAIGGGIFAGTLFSRMLNTGVIPFTRTALPASLTVMLQKARPLHGILHIILGSLVAAKSRNKYVQDAGIGIAALGGFDIVMQVAARLGVPGLPTFSGMNVDLLGRYQAPGRVSGMNVNLRGHSRMMGEARPGPQTETHLADALNEMVS